MPVHSCYSNVVSEATELDDPREFSELEEARELPKLKLEVKLQSALALLDACSRARGWLVLGVDQVRDRLESRSTLLGCFSALLRSLSRRSFLAFSRALAAALALLLPLLVSGGGLGRDTERCDVLDYTR